MNTTLLMFYDAARKDYAAVSVPAAREFCRLSGIRFDVYTMDHGDPYMAKVDFITERLQHFERVIYADVDVLFRPAACDIGGMFRNHFGVSVDNYGLCSGFMTFRQGAMAFRLLELWIKLGAPDWPEERRDARDQGTLQLLFDHWTWVKQMTQLLPVGLVSNPECLEIGSLAHHFWARGGNLEKMKNFQWTTNPQPQP